MEEKLKQSYENFLDPKILRSRIIECTLFIAIFEYLKDSIISQIRNFFATDYDERGGKPSAKYQATVLNRNPSPAYASLDWLKENHVIEQADIDTFNRLKQIRNDLAHGLLKILGTSGPPPDLAERFVELIALSHKITHWWVKNVHLDTDPDFDGQDIKDEDITPGSTMMIRLLIDVALGDESTSNYYIEQWRKHLRKGKL